MVVSSAVVGVVGAAAEVVVAAMLVVVVSWIEKARERGILSETTPGAVGGIVTRERRARPRV